MTATAEQALILWITALQTESEYGLPGITVLVPGSHAPTDRVELDLHNDDPTNLTDGTWTEPIVTMQDEDEEQTPTSPEASL